MTELTVKEMAARERVHEDTVYRWIAKGAVAVKRTSGGHGIRVIVDTPDVEARVPKRRPCGVYFIRCERFIKIGYAGDVVGRLSALGVSSPFELVPLGYIPCESEREAKELEFVIHGHFEMFKLDGRREWFTDAEPIRVFVSERGAAWPRVIPRRVS